MRTVSKKLLFALFGFVFVVSCLFIGTSFNKKSNQVSAESTVTFSSIVHNNINYASSHALPMNTSSNRPTDGIYATLSFSENFGYVVDTVNYATSDYAIGTGMKVNGTPIKDISGAFVDFAHAGANICVYIPFSGLDEYKRASVTVDEGTEFKGKYISAFSVYFKGSGWSTTPNTKTAVTYSSIPWNNKNYAPSVLGGGNNGLLIAFSSDLTTIANERSGDLEFKSIYGKYIKYNGQTLDTISGAELRHYTGSNLWIYVPNMTTRNYMVPTIEISANSPFLDVILPSLKLYCTNNSWSTTDPKTSVTYSKLEWNNVDYSGGSFSGAGVLIKYSGNLSTITTEINGGIKATELKSIYGKYITLNGQTLDNVSGAELRYHSQGFLWIYAPNMTSWLGQIPTITIAENTPFLDANLPALTLYFNSSAWQTTSPRRAVTYSTISWNNKDYSGGIFGGNGVLITYSDNLSLIATEINGSVKTTELKSLYGQYITLNGVTLNNIAGAELRYFQQQHLWIYAPNMTTNASGIPTIEIASNTPFSYSSLPALKLYWDSSTSSWGTTKPLRDVAFSAIEWNNTDYSGGIFGGAGVLLTFNGNLSDDNNEVAGTLQSTELKSLYGAGITVNGQTLDTIAGAELRYHSVGYLWIYTPTMTTWAGQIPTITIAENTQFLDAVLPALTFYFNGSEWQITNPRRAVTYSSISWNNNDYSGGVFGGNGVLITYNLDLSLIATEINGNIKTTELKSVYGQYITINGVTMNNIAGAELRYFQQQHLWIYAPTMTEGDGGIPTIVIQANAPFSYSTLPELTLYFIGGEWSTTFVVPDLGTANTVFYGFVNGWNNKLVSGQCLSLLGFQNFEYLPSAVTEYTTTTGHYIKLNGSPLVGVNNARIHYANVGEPWMQLNIPYPSEGDILTIEAGTPFAGNYLPGLVFKFVDGVWCKGFTVTITIGTDVYKVYSQDDVPFTINDEYFETLLASKAIPAKMLSFTIRGVTYGAGTTFNVLTDTNIVVKTIGFNTSIGASVRLNNPTGIRFETTIKKADYNSLVSTYGASNVETGTYILPKSMLEGSDFRSFFADSSKTNGVDYVKVVNSGFANKDTLDTDDFCKFYGSLTNISPVNYCTEFFGIGYIQVTTDKDVYIFYGGYDLASYTRNIFYVAGMAYPDYETNTSEKAVLKSYLDGVVCIEDEVVLSTITDIAGYESPYSLDYDSQTGVYTITGNAQIRSVMIGGRKRVSTRTNTLTVGNASYYVTNYSLNTTNNSSTLTFKLSSVPSSSSLVDFALEVPYNRGVKILQLTDTELIDSSQMTDSSLTSSQQEEYARKNVYKNCFNYISQLVEDNRPDLIIITGDIVNGNYDDNGSMWLKIIEFLDSLDIPWAPVFGSLENQSAMGASWQRSQLALADNCLFNAGTVTGNGDYTIGITDGDVLRRVIYMLDSNGSSGVSSAQINWVKSVSSTISSYYGNIPGFICCNKYSSTDYSADLATAHIDGVFIGNSPYDNSTTLTNNVYYTYGTKTGSYGIYDANKLGGTYINLTVNGLGFTVTEDCINKTDMENKEFIHLVESFDNSSVVTDAYLKPIWDTDRVYDETGIFVGETGSVTLMYTPTNPSEVVVRDITLGVTYTYGIDYTISGDKITRVAGGNLPYMPYEEYYRTNAMVVNGVSQTFKVTPDGNGKAEDGYTIGSDIKYLYYSEASLGVSKYVTFTYNKTEAWTGTTITQDANATTFIDKLKTEKEATIMFYGDSITVGCNASGTEYGDNRNPNLPAWNDLVTNYLEDLYGANITKYNGAVGGWTTAQGAENLSSKLTEIGTSLDQVDLFVIAFGMNDPQTSQASYESSIKQMIDAYYSANPTGSVLLVSPMQPNTQSIVTLGNQNLWENALASIKNSGTYSGKNISLARVNTIFKELVSVSGKLSRDYLGNNVNHPNDFGVRIYAQVILTTLCGDDFN